MPKIKYQEFNFRPATLALIKTANQIIAEYQRQGFDLTLRQLYYQFVSPERDRSGLRSPVQYRQVERPTVQTGSVDREGRAGWSVRENMPGTGRAVV